jgi:hypothetical protein
VRPFSVEEDRLIVAWRIRGVGTSEIAMLLYHMTRSRRSQATIGMRLKTLAANDEREE